MSDNEIERFEKVIRKIFDERLKDFYIERERHYQEHEFIKELMTWSNSAKSTFWKITIGMITTALIGFTIMGFVVWGKNKIGK
jgi:predicted phosphoadenosine phosphosulfate sulfurtransferase